MLIIIVVLCALRYVVV